MLHPRPLTEDDIPLLKLIDRAEVIDEFYCLQDGQLRCYPQHEVVPGWPEGEAEHDALILQQCYQRGGWLYGIFDGPKLVAAAVVDCLPIDNAGLDLRQLKFLHVSQAYRGLGLGRQLFALAREQALAMGGQGLYVSATPSRHTVDFYTGLGCKLLATPDPTLLRIEPEDIHLYLPLA
ncbi:GNAT family N-acetyltransferase [Pseudomonas sp. Fl5BN2]|uniref:GNAT family N-acetyltransferase n=1 Tax=unclassified Pseudomonas TaxID=196821 RepID=UPI0013784115|nr:MULTISPECIES: GNAT family N-acetyltransferase [unclassified Pseudomonas]NBF04819.1 GNAT family N-acetyltransferase [Pseudomonas sp. Fl5BN2]NBF10244.1 GNAT family N-acetyltransferase [Pseudomonas sp. Fl4BN1]